MVAPWAWETAKLHLMDGLHAPDVTPLVPMTEHIHHTWPRRASRRPRRPPYDARLFGPRPVWGERRSTGESRQCVPCLTSVVVLREIIWESEQDNTNRGIKSRTASSHLQVIDRVHCTLEKIAEPACQSYRGALRQPATFPPTRNHSRDCHLPQNMKRGKSTKSLLLE